jgi:hypothetical protein
LAEHGGGRDAVSGASLERVFGDIGEIQRVVEDPRLIVAREHKEDVDEPFGVIDGLADVDRHRHQFEVCRLRLGEDDVDRGAHDGQWRAKFVAGVGDELPLAAERAIEPLEHDIEGVGELAQFVARTLQGDALGEVLLGCRPSGVGKTVHRRQDASGGDPTGERGEQDDAGQAEHRVGQQARQGRAALSRRARPFTIGIERGALIQDPDATPELRGRDALTERRLN